MTDGTVVALSRSSTHTFRKDRKEELQFTEGHGIEGDAHAGKKVKHRSMVKKDPNAPNLRQVHLIHEELFHFLSSEYNISVQPGFMGENVTTAGIDLLELPTGAILKLGNEVTIQVTGLRNPCNQLNSIDPTLMSRVLQKQDDGSIIRLAGIMAIVLKGGKVQVNDYVSVELPEGPHNPLKPV